MVRAAVAFLITLLAAGCASAPSMQATPDSASAKPDSILIYGRPTCGNCQALRASLDAAGIAYTDFNVDTDPAKNDEMWKKMESVTADTDSVMLPVVDVNGTILVSAPTSVEALRPYLRGKGK
jgi:glutaredoxin